MLRKHNVTCFIAGCHILMKRNEKPPITIDLFALIKILPRLYSPSFFISLFFLFFIIHPRPPFLNHQSISGDAKAKKNEGK